MANIAKISVEKKDSREQILYDLDKDKSLCELIRDICQKTGLPESPVYGLKLIQTKDKVFRNSYLSNTSYKNIQHSDCLKIVFSIEYLLKHRILPHLNDLQESPERQICYEDLQKLSMDSVFIEELAKSGNHLLVIAAFFENDLEESEQLALIITVCHLLQKGYISDTTQDFLQKTVSIVKQRQHLSHIVYALSILQKILVQKDDVFLLWKVKIIKEVTVTELIPFIWMKETNKSLQYGTVLLINTLIRVCKSDQKKKIINEMNLRQNRSYIYEHIIVPGDIEKNMEHELYVLQTYILSLYNDGLKSEVNLNNSHLFNREEFELSNDDDIVRLSVLMDFDETENPRPRSKTVSSISYENLSYAGSERLSLASIMSDSTLSQRSSRKMSFCVDFDSLKINYLSLEALKYFKNKFSKIFNQSQIEEKIYEPGIFATSDRVVKMLAKILDIGLDPPNIRSTFYQPIVFNCSSMREPFFFELFSRTMWLLSRTRREMKVTTITDYPKVMKVLEKQLKMTLAKKPINFKSLTNEMTEINFEVVLNQLQKEKDEEMEILLSTHPCIQEMKQVYSKENEHYVYKMRMNVLKNGAEFPRVLNNNKKILGSIFVQLSKNERELMIYNVNNKTSEQTIWQTLNVEDITHIAVGKNCKHSNLCKPVSLAFSIIIKDVEDHVHFIAKNQKMANYWIDALCLLKGLVFKSEDYQSELDELVEMDVLLKLLETQNIAIPKSPPAVPPMPLECKPPVPPKSEDLVKHQKKSTAKLAKCK